MDRLIQQLLKIVGLLLLTFVLLCAVAQTAVAVFAQMWGCLAAVAIVVPIVAGVTAFFLYRRRYPMAPARAAGGASGTAPRRRPRGGDH